MHWPLYPSLMRNDQTVLFTHKETGFALPVHIKSGVAGIGSWLTESFQLAPFLLLGDTPLIAPTAVESYLFTIECLPDEQAIIQEMTLVGRGVAQVPGRGRSTAFVPWECQLSYIYNRHQAVLTAFLQPRFHVDKSSGTVHALPPLHYGLQITWEPGWVQRGKRWAVTPAGILLATPRQTGVDGLITTTTYTNMADDTAPAAMIILQATPPDSAATIGRLYSRLQVQHADPTQQVHADSIPVVTDWSDVAALCQVPTSADWQQSITIRSAPSQAPASRAEDSRLPGRYRLMLELTAPQLPGPLVLIFPFRYWPAAAANPVQAQFAQLLLCADIGNDYVAAYNFVAPSEYYQADDRDDVLAEQAYIAYALGNLLSEPDLHHLSVAMADKLLKHQQPDGGFTFGISVNGMRADYSDSNADAVTCLLTLVNSPHLDEERRQRYEQALLRSARFMLSFQDPSGFFWGRVERPDVFKYPHQPWFTSYVVVSCLDIIRYLQFRVRSAHSEDGPQARQNRFAGSAMAGPIQDAITAPICPESAPFLAAIERGLRWLCSVQTESGAWRYDTSGSYADYDDLSNTAVAVWALSIAVRMLPHNPERLLCWQAATAGVRYLLTREIPSGSGQFFGAGIPRVQKLVYDYRLGFALQEYLYTRQNVDSEVPASAVDTAGADDDDSAFITAIKAALTRYIQYVTDIQGRGTLTGGWASLYSFEHQCYLHTYSWFERGSAWHKYVFLGWQGKLALLDDSRLR